MDTATSAVALGHLLAAMEYGTAKEDRPFTDKMLAQFNLPRSGREELIERILASPGLEPFFLAMVRETRPFALMLKEVYELLSRFGTTAERRAALFRVSQEGAQAAFDFDLDAFPKEIMRYIAQIDVPTDILRIAFGSSDEAAERFSWYTSETRKLWDAVSPRWDGDFYDDGFHVALSFAGSILDRADAESKERAEELVAPIVDCLRGLTDAVRWPELGGVAQRILDGVGQSYMNGQPERLRIVTYPPRRSRLDRDAAIAYFRHQLSEDDEAPVPSLSGPVDEILWDQLARTLLAMSVTVDLWQRRVERKDSHGWIAGKFGKPLEEVTPAEYLAVLEPLAKEYTARLGSLLNHSDQVLVPQLQEALIEFLCLPFWKDRWFLYELWTLCRVLTLAGSRWPVALEGVQRRADGVLEWKLPGGLAANPVAVIGAGREVECWTQRKTLHPISGEGLEPDLRITRSTEGHPDVFVVENKDRRRPRTGDMAEIMTRYVTGTQARCVCLVNYETFTKPTHALPPSASGREVLILSHFRPTEEPAEFRLRLMQILAEELPESTPAEPQKATSAVAEFLEVALAWSGAPADLDLHAWIERVDGSHHIYYAAPGGLDGPPHASLGADVKEAPGSELLKLRTEGLVRVVLAVHRYSGDQIGAASVEIRGLAGGPHRIERPAGTAFAWWHVAEIDGKELSVTVLNAPAVMPPVADKH